MAVYSVYEPPTEALDIALRAERLSFVKEGFSWPALFVPLLWVLYHRMWIEFVVLLAIFVAIGFAFGTDAQGQTLAFWASLAVNLLVAFEANDFRAASLERRGYRLVGIASGRGRAEAELSFFRTWLPQQSGGAKPTERGTERRREFEPQAGSLRGEGEEVIGLFPKP